MRKLYAYTFDGSGADGQTWHTYGTVECEFLDALHEATRASFDQLTHGRATYGRPGVGCTGPYDITRAVLEQVKQ